MSRRSPSDGVPIANAQPDRMRLALQLEIPSDISYIERVVEVVSRQCADFHFPASICSLNVPVALSEALSNAILRGNRQDGGKQVRVRMEMDHEHLVLEVVDQGDGFDFDACLRDPTKPENLDREDGRGLFLMRRLMDRVDRYVDGGNVVRLTLKRA
jgi:serine/threonine-protein kinase RsbW